MWVKSWHYYYLKGQVGESRQDEKWYPVQSSIPLSVAVLTWRWDVKEEMENRMTRTINIVIRSDGNGRLTQRRVCGPFSLWWVCIATEHHTDDNATEWCGIYWEHVIGVMILYSKTVNAIILWTWNASQGTSLPGDGLWDNDRILGLLSN